MTALCIDCHVNYGLFAIINIRAFTMLQCCVIRVIKDYSFLQNAEFWAESWNLSICPFPWNFYVSRNFVPASDRATNSIFWLGSGGCRKLITIMLTQTVLVAHSTALMKFWLWIKRFDFGFFCCYFFFVLATCTKQLAMHQFLMRFMHCKILSVVLALPFHMLFLCGLGQTFLW